MGVGVRGLVRCSKFEVHERWSQATNPEPDHDTQPTSNPTPRTPNPTTNPEPRTPNLREQSQTANPIWCPPSLSGTGDGRIRPGAADSESGAAAADDPMGERRPSRQVQPEYPRPQMVRPEWKNLNGLWDYAITARERRRRRTHFAGRSSCRSRSSRSSAARALGHPGSAPVVSPHVRGARPARRRPRPAPLRRGRLGGRRLRQRQGGRRARGGYDPFTFDITDALKRRAASRSWSFASGIRPTRGSSRAASRCSTRGIWYTAVTGIWQTVWLEPVPRHTSSACVSIRTSMRAHCASPWTRSATAARRRHRARRRPRRHARRRRRDGPRRASRSRCRVAEREALVARPTRFSTTCASPGRPATRWRATSACARSRCGATIAA